MDSQDNTTNTIKSAINQWSNAFYRLSVPSNLMDKSDVINIESTFSVVGRVLFLYGERTGEVDSVPLARDYLRNSDIDPGTESLWDFTGKGGLGIPKNMISKEIPEFYIKTGQVFVCPKCHGTGQQKCWKCRGRGVVKKYKNNHPYWEPCSECGHTGYITCSKCIGCRLMAGLIKIKTKYSIWSISEAIAHNTRVPADKIAETDGETIVDIVEEYPLQETIKGISSFARERDKFDRVHELVKSRLTDLTDKMVNENTNYGHQILRLIDASFSEMYDKVRGNKPFDREILPIRVMLAIDRIAVHKVTYNYKDDEYEIFVYGRQNKVYATDYPQEFTYKAGIVLCLVILALIVAILIANAHGTY